MKKILRNILIGIISFIVIIFIINQITVYPFIMTFKTLMSNVKIQGNIGNYEEKIKEIENIDVIKNKHNASKSTIYLYSKRSNDKLPLIVLIHGGGWVSGSSKSIEWYGKLLASNDYIVASIDYSLAPKYKFPISTKEINDDINYLYKNADKYNIDNTKIFIGGNSAGAHLASQIGGIITNDDYKLYFNINETIPKESLKGLFLFNGVYNFKTAKDCNFPFYKKLVWAYTGVKNIDKFDGVEYLSSINSINKDYPSVFITVGDIDPLEPQTLEFIDKLNKNNIDTESVLWTNKNKKLYHDYIYEMDTDEAIYNYEQLIKFLNKRSKGEANETN